LPLLAARLVRWRAWRGCWLPDYLRRQRPFDLRAFPPDRPIDVMVLVADHFEPARRFGDEAAADTVRSWCAAYEALAAPHRDADGRPPRHTWFYRYDYPNSGCLRLLSESVFRGFGEIEFHLHHGHDTRATFAAMLRDGLNWFNRHGAMLTAEEQPRQSFGYVAGNWALDNGAGDPAFSGCDTELAALREAGCYADFTFPALGSRAQPRKSNAIYYAAEDGAAKSYDAGVDVAVGGPPWGDLMLMQGPLVLDWARGRVEDAALEDTAPPDPRRLPAWLSAHVHVRGRPEWVFIKLHTHAMQARASFLGPPMDATFAALEACWNRPPFRLHYVTAREAFNMVKAAEAGHSGDPNDFRDYLLPVPANRRFCCDVPWRLVTCTPRHVCLEILGEGNARIQFDAGELRTVAGQLRQVDVSYEAGRVQSIDVVAEGLVAVDPPRLGALLATGERRGVSQPRAARHHAAYRG
jgi:hypothetical protein